MLMVVAVIVEMMLLMIVKHDSQHDENRPFVMLLLVVFAGGCDVRNPKPMDAEYCNWQMDAVYKHEHESWWHMVTPS